MADYGILYNDVSLQAAVPLAQVTDIIVQPIPIAWTEIERVANNGSLLARKKLAKRNVWVEVELPLDPSVAAMAANARNLRVWAESDHECPLTLPDYPGKYLNSVLTQMDNFSLRDWWKPIKLTFTAFYEPHFVSALETHGQVGTAFTVQGDVPACLNITHQITNALTNPIWTLATGYIVALTGTFASGTITIDTEHGYVSKDGESLMPYLSPASRFFRFPKGNHLITGPAGGTTTWRERWRD